ncbi:hypothetical protein [uncultured Marinobacter sp.]|uniref:hypothetical protein n=1 Tax=uncultured Marinobacter sp. TaxID=187379 RepID=UPI0030DB6BFF|tara:strand:+ start:133 stop:345 length:213 start_codon:yes stop_codon:yes gene_type:complete
MTRHPNCKPITVRDRPSLTGITKNRERHDEIERQTAEFLAAGGEITVLDGYQNKPKRQHHFNNRRSPGEF